jgi:hypothetical protein
MGLRPGLLPAVPTGLAILLLLFLPAECTPTTVLCETDLVAGAKAQIYLRLIGTTKVVP